jgi:hypothetical protein
MSWWQRCIAEWRLARLLRQAQRLLTPQRRWLLPWRRLRPWLLTTLALCCVGAVGITLTYVKLATDCASEAAAYPYIVCVQRSPLAVFFGADTVYTQAAGSASTPSLQAVSTVGNSTTTALITTDAGDPDLRCEQGIVAGAPGLRCYDAAGVRLPFNNTIEAGKSETTSIDNGAGTQVTCRTMDDTGLTTYAAVESCGSQNKLTVTGATTLAVGPIVTDATASKIAVFDSSKKLVPGTVAEAGLLPAAGGTLTGTLTMTGSGKFTSDIAFTAANLVVDGVNCVQSDVAQSSYPAETTISCLDNDNGRMVLRIPKMPSTWDAGVLSVTLTGFSLTNQSGLTMIADMQVVCTATTEQLATAPATGTTNTATITFSNQTNTINHSNTVAITTSGCSAGESLRLIIDNEDSGTATQSITTGMWTGGLMTWLKTTSN